MLKFTLAQMRQSLGRLVAAGLAIVLGTAFVAAAFAASSAISQTLANFALKNYGDSDAVLFLYEPNTKIENLNDIPGIADSVNANSIGLNIGTVNASDGSIKNSGYLFFSEATPNEKLQVQKISAGTLPDADSEIAISEKAAEDLEASLGDEIIISFPNPNWSADQEGVDRAIRKEFTLVGFTKDAPLTNSGVDNGLLFASDYAEIASQINSVSTEVNRDYILIELEPNADLVAIDDAINLQIGNTFELQSSEYITANTLENYTGQNDFMLVILLGFASIALVVAALVISNTFQVLVAHRARTLALLRAIGATKQQIRQSVIIESLIIGAVASVIGIMVGVLLTNLAARIVHIFAPDVPIAEEGFFSVGATIFTLVIGILITLIAAISPSRVATRFSPIMALQPYEGLQQKQVKTTRIIVSLAMLVVGSGILFLSVLVGTSQEGNSSIISTALVAGIFGGFIAAIGLMMSTVLFTPALINAAGKILPRKVTPQVATKNASRNRFRTAATINALIIGAGLVAMMSTAGLSAKASLNNSAEALYIGPDLIFAPMWELVTNDDGEISVQGSFTENQKAIMQEAAGLKDSIFYYSGTFSSHSKDGSAGYISLNAADGLVKDFIPQLKFLDTLEDGAIYMSVYGMQEYGFQPGTEISISFEPYHERNYTVKLKELNVNVPGVEFYGAYATVNTLKELDFANFRSEFWANISPDANADEVQQSIYNALQENALTEPFAPRISMFGSYFNVQETGAVIDAILAVVMVLLALTVLIALIGVANTLSLSVVERRRESATLRAMGLTKGQLRGMLAIEGVLISLAGAVIGAVFGVLMGWAGIAIVFGSAPAEISYVLPLTELGIIVLIAIVAGVLASVLPARSAAKADIVSSLNAE